MDGTIINKKKARVPNVRRRKELLFYTLMMVIPVIQVTIFYFVINFNSILLSLKEYFPGEAGGLQEGYYFIKGNLFKNFIDAFKDLGGREYSLKAAFGNSLIAFGLQTLILPWIAMLFSYYIYKKRFGGRIFSIFLFLPAIVSPLVITRIYKVMLDDALPQYLSVWFGGDFESIYTLHTMESVLSYYILTSFGTSVLLYSGAMSGIDTSVMEAADIDGAVGFKCFIHVVFPLVYPTFVTFVTVGVAHIFTNQLNLFSFETGDAEKKYWTYGYYLFRYTVGNGSKANYPYLSALGVIFTAIALPLTFGARAFLKKIGPSVD